MWGSLRLAPIIIIISHFDIVKNTENGVVDQVLSNFMIVTQDLLNNSILSLHRLWLKGRGMVISSVGMVIS